MAHGVPWILARVKESRRFGFLSKAVDQLLPAPKAPPVVLPLLWPGRTSELALLWDEKLPVSPPAAAAR